MARKTAIINKNQEERSLSVQVSQKDGISPVCSLFMT